MIKSVVWSNMLDYPNQVSTTLFVGTCNWRCGFCYNLPMLDMPSINFDKDILPKLITRQTMINHVVISGGECTAWNGTKDIIKKLKQHGFIVGIHTNGSNYRFLRSIIDDISYIGMDIKTSDAKYNNITNCNIDIEDINKSIQLIANSDKEYEFRTTIYPKYVSKKDCINIAKKIKNYGADKYVLQQFDTSNLDTNVAPYSLSHLLEIKNACNKIIPTYIRGGR